MPASEFAGLRPHRPVMRSLVSTEFKPAFAFSFLNPLYDVGCVVLGLGAPFSGMLLGILENNGIADNGSVLDVGCGSGTFIAALKRRMPRVMVTGLDPDPSMLKIAEKKLAKTGATGRFVQGFVQELEFPDASFDFVVSTLVFHHLSPEVKQEGAEEIRRVLRPGGIFLLADIGRQRSAAMRVLFTAFSVLDGQKDMRDNLRGILPDVLLHAGFDVNEVGSSYRGVRFFTAKKP